MDELKPCPYCKGRLVCVSQGIPEESRIDSYIQCESCGMRGPATKTLYVPGKLDLEEPKRASRDKWNSLPRDPVWTNELPTKAGWYWWSYRSEPIKVRQDDAGTLYFEDNGIYLPIKPGLNGKFARIPEPEQPK